MRFEKLSAEELSANPEYVRVLRTLKVGEGVRATVKEEGVGKITIKQKLAASAVAAGIKIKFRRSDPDTVILEVIDPGA